MQPAGPGKTTVAVRLLHVPDSKPVEGAVILGAKTDMGPAGLYRFLTETSMAGKWELIVSAKVQGETDTISGAITFDAAT